MDEQQRRMLNTALLAAYATRGIQICQLAGREPTTELVMEALRPSLAAGASPQWLADLERAVNGVLAAAASLRIN